MNILGIETSCDETSICLLKASKNNFEILSHSVLSQIKIHEKWGGVYPLLAKREHQKNLVPVLKKTLQKAGFLKKTNIKLKKDDSFVREIYNFSQAYQRPKIDLIATTVGPGLDPCLWAGLNFSKALSTLWNIPIVGVNHIEAHFLIALLKKKKKGFSLLNFSKIFPAISLIVSGGHTQLILIENIGQYKIIGETRDDAAGECFDKTARVLNLGYPGGPAISKRAKYSKNPILLPRPMINDKNYDFSFSGLKTAVLYYDKSLPKKKKTQVYINNMSAGIEQSIVDVLVKKTISASQDFKVKTIILGGGVTANKKLRKEFLKYSKQYNILIPDVFLSTDNALMIALAGYLQKKPPALEVNPNLKV